MRALNPTLSKLSNTTTSDSGTRNSSGNANANSKPVAAGITTDNLNRLSQPKLRAAPPATTPTPAQRAAVRSASSEARPTNPKPRPSSRQSAISAISSHSNNANHNNNNKLGVPGNQRTTAPEPLSSRRGTRPPTIITTTVSRNPRLAARSEPVAAAKPSPQAKSTTTSSSSSVAATAVPPASAPVPAPAPSPRRPSARSTATAAAAAAAADAASRPALSPSSSSSSSSPRLPSHARDDNVTSMTQHLQTSKSGRMPYDRSSTANNAARPTMPTLSATAARGTNKAPITPKVATKPSQQPAATPTASRTPLSSRPQRLSGPPSGVGGPPRSAPQSDDDISSHISLSATPRSGTRPTRVDSAGSTPNGTPNPDRADGRFRSNRSSIGRLPSSPVADAPKRQHVTFTSTSGARPHVKQEPHHDPDSKFFYASNAKPTQQAPPPKPTLAKAPVFFYANGNSVDNKSHGPPTSAPAPQHHIDDGLSNKFMYANGKSELRPTPSAPTSRPSSIISTSSRAAPAGRSGTSTVGSAVGSSTGYPIGQRSTSPIKYNQPAPMAEVLNGGQNHQHTGRPRAASPPRLGPSPAVMRRSSTGTSRESHSRSGSLVVGESGLRSPYVASGPSSPSIESASQPQQLTLASIIQAAEDFGDDQDESVSGAEDSHSDVQSPAKSTHSADKSTNSADPANDLVANARRERKVQDLQITNASLEAINRTLERQLRKQTSELRRFKRLSRSGRLSMIPAEVAEGAFAAASNDADGDGIALSDLSEGEERDGAGEGDEDDSLTDTDSASGALSPSVLAEKEQKHLNRDEKRLQLDLSKHQELLIDSQKINQSIKRCLDWTEELIKEGRKALEYQVRPADVVIPGPRVLNPADEDDDMTQGSIDFEQGLDDTATVDDEDEPKTLDVPITPMLAGWNSGGAVDRDSGIGLSKERG